MIWRFIPVGAGNSLAAIDAVHALSVYPRGCGELIGFHVCDFCLDGLSPWVRGTLLQVFFLGSYHRFIPVGAGNSVPPATVPSEPTVYPRGCGELVIPGGAFSTVNGLSPWVRGTPGIAARAKSGTRFIPVGAGNSLTQPIKVNWLSGLSPWVRGTRRCVNCCLAKRRFIPVGAGNSMKSPENEPRIAVYPRGCGELLSVAGRITHSLGLSPWVRGTLYLTQHGLDIIRFIPVGAGNSILLFRLHCKRPVYPRGCGELSD